MALRFFNCDDPPDCRDNRGSCGKWNAAQAAVVWFGYDGFTDVTPACPHEGCLYGGRKFLSQSIVAACHNHQSSARWNWGADVESGEWGWTLSTCSAGFDETLSKTTLISARTGCSKLTVNDYSISGDGGSCGCVDDVPSIVFPISPFDDDCGFGVIIHTTPIEIIGQLSASCSKIGQFKYLCAGDSPIFDGGTKAELLAFLTSGGADATVDDITNTHVGFTTSIDISYTNPDYPPGTPPPAGVIGVPQSICAATEIHVSLSASLTLAIEHNDQSLYALGVELLDHYNLATTQWHGEVVCPGGAFAASWGSTVMPLLTFVDDDPVACTYKVQQTYVSPGSPESPPVFLQWGAFVAFTTDSGTEGITIQKWAMRQGSYLPAGYQDGAPKTWKYLRQIWTTDFCSLAATFFCEEKTGSKGRRIFISPNGEGGGLPNSDSFWFEDGYTFVIERTAGYQWRSLFKDADGDRYPDTCAPTATGEVPVEPTSCACNCPDATMWCPPHGLGQCPQIPADNFPPFGP